MSLKKPKVLSLKDKVYILELLQKGYSVSGLAIKNCVAKSTVCSIKKKNRELTNRVNNTLYGTGNVKHYVLLNFRKWKKPFINGSLACETKNCQ